MSDHHVLDHVDQYLGLAREYGASDLHLATGFPPAWRLSGQLVPIWGDHPDLTAADTERLAHSFLGPQEIERLTTKGDVDFAYASHSHEGRYRASVVKQRLGLDMVFRIITNNIRTMEEIGLPTEHLIPLTRYQNGLILVTGSVGSGKSTTLASIIDFINKDREDHILTLEDPIEYLYDCHGCQITQREIPEHSVSFARALRAALREDPDVIIVGEMRDLETISLALSAAETGHLVLGTLHTGNAPRTLDRVLDVFPIEQRDQIRIMVSESLRGILSQQLVPKADGSGRVLALEILINTPAVSACIREGKTFMLPGIMQTGKTLGMVTMDESLKSLYIAGKISAQDLLFRADDKSDIRAFLNS